MLIIVIALTSFAGALFTGLIAVVWLGIFREEADYSLRLGPATRASALTRRIVGLHVTFRP